MILKIPTFLNIDLTFDRLNQIHLALDLTGSTDNLRISNISLGTWCLWKLIQINTIWNASEVDFFLIIVFRVRHSI